MAANLSAYLARYFPVLLVDLGIDETHVSASAHGVDLAPGEVGIVQAWLASLDGAPQPPMPIVKPSARANRVYVMPPGPVVSHEISRRSYYVKDAVAKLYSLTAYQAKMYHTPIVIFDTPASEMFNDLALAVCDIALVVLAASSETPRVLNGIMARVGKILNKKHTFIVANKEITPLNLVAPFPVYHLPYSPEVETYTQRRDIFIIYKPESDRGRKWQAMFINLAEAVAKKAKELMGI